MKESAFRDVVLHDKNLDFLTPTDGIALVTDESPTLGSVQGNEQDSVMLDRLSVLVQGAGFVRDNPVGTTDLTSLDFFGLHWAPPCHG